MSRTQDHGDPERIGRDNHAGLPIFASPESAPALEKGLDALERTAGKNERQIQRLIPIAQELARKAGDDGATVSDLRLTAVQRGILTGQESGRQLGYLGSVMRRAGLVNAGHYRHSHLLVTHGRPQVVWRTK